MKKSKESKKRVKASLDFDMNSNSPDNPPVMSSKKVHMNPKHDQEPRTFRDPKKVNSPPLASETADRGDMDIGNLQQKIESKPLKNLKKYQRIHK